MAEYSEGKWKVNKLGFDWVIMVYDNEGNMVSSGVATCGGEGNAQLIVSTVNACISLNKENPLAVAEGMENVTKALRMTANYIHHIWHLDSELEPGRVAFKLHGEDFVFDFAELQQALAKAEGK